MLIEEYPDLRFCQILEMLNLNEDKFYQESKDTYDDILVTLVDYNLDPATVI